MGEERRFHRLRQSEAASSRPPSLLVLLAAVVFAGAVGCSTTPQPPPSAPAHSSVYKVGAPDVLTVTILPEPITTTSVMVRPDGMISIPLVGDVLASGRTIEEIATEIEDKIGRFKRNASVSVALQRRGLQRRLQRR